MVWVGVVDVALEVDQSGPLLQHSGIMPLPHSVGDGVHIGVALADIHIVPDTDDVRHKGDHVGGLPDGLAVGDLALALVQVLHLQAQQIAGGGEGEPGAGGVVPEQGDAQPGVKHLGGDIPLPEGAEDVRHRPDGLQLVVGFLPGEEKVIVIHILAVQPLELSQQGVELLSIQCHGSSLLISYTGRASRRRPQRTVPGRISR